MWGVGGENAQLAAAKFYFVFFRDKIYQVLLSELAPPCSPPLRKRVSPPGTKGKGGTHSLADEGDPNRTTEEKAWQSVYSVATVNAEFIPR